MSNYITKEGMERLYKRMSELMEERPKVIQQVVTAREMGDLSENAEYHAARERQRHIDQELGFIQGRLASLKMIDPSTLAKDAIRFGAYVQLIDLLNQQQVQYHLVGIDEIYDRTDGIVQVSVASPLGKAMIGKKPGEEFIVKAPIGDKRYKVLDIK